VFKSTGIIQHLAFLFFDGGNFNSIERAFSVAQDIFFFQILLC